MDAPVIHLLLSEQMFVRDVSFRPWVPLHEVVLQVVQEFVTVWLIAEPLACHTYPRSGYVRNTEHTQHAAGTAQKGTLVGPVPGGTLVGLIRKALDKSDYVIRSVALS